MIPTIAGASPSTWGDAAIVSSGTGSSSPMTTVLVGGPARTALTGPLKVTVKLSSGSETRSSTIATATVPEPAPAGITRVPETAV